MSKRYNSAAVQSALRQWEATPGQYGDIQLSAVLRTDWDEIGPDRRRVQRLYATIVGLADVVDYVIGAEIVFDGKAYSILNRDGDAFGQVRLTLGGV